jgi:hypothetical protein
MDSMSVVAVEVVVRAQRFGSVVGGGEVADVEGRMRFRRRGVMCAVRRRKVESLDS